LPLKLLVKVVAMEMRQCEYRAVIPSALACSAPSFFGAAVGFILDMAMWILKCGANLTVFLLIALVVCAFTGYGSRYVASLPEVIENYVVFVFEHEAHIFYSLYRWCMPGYLAERFLETASMVMEFERLSNNLVECTL
jgi:hypothetical protein